MKIYQEAEQFILSRDSEARERLDVKADIENRLLELQKQKDPEYYGRQDGVVHVSDLTKCLRGVALEMLGAKKDKQIDARQAGVFQAGNLFEEFVIDTFGDRVIERQREYRLTYKSITLVGRSDYLLDDGLVRRLGENKSMHSKAFWYMEKEGKKVKYQHEQQLQTYMWLERELNRQAYHGIVTYISKDDCTIVARNVDYNYEIIEEIVLPALDILNEVWEKKDPLVAPICPDTHWMSKYCDYHQKCCESEGVPYVVPAVKKPVARKKKTV